MRTVLAAIAGARRPAPRRCRRRRSTRNCTSVSPSAVTGRRGAGGGRRPGRAAVGGRAVLVAGRRRTAGRSRQPPVTPTEGTLCQAERAAGHGRVGRRACGRCARCCRRRRPAGDQPEALPSESTARNWTSVWPSAETVTDAPAWAALQVAPPSVDVRVLVVVEAGLGIARAGRGRRSRRRRSARPRSRRATAGSDGPGAVDPDGAAGVGDRRRPGRDVARRVDRAELHDRLALGGDRRRVARDRACPS